MQDVMGIALLLGLAFLFKSFFHSTVMLHVTVRVIPFNLISYWILLGLSAVWLAFAGLAFVLRTYHQL
jgi:hypothetical protein